jgi:hypothetical protein
VKGIRQIFRVKNAPITFRNKWVVLQQITCSIISKFYSNKFILADQKTKNIYMYIVYKYKDPDPEWFENPYLDPEKIIPDPQNCMIHEGAIWAKLCFERANKTEKWPIHTMLCFNLSDGTHMYE